MRIGSESLDAQPDDFFVFRPGPAFAHSVRNTGSEPLRYLCLDSKAEVRSGLPTASCSTT